MMTMNVEINRSVCGGNMRAIGCEIFGGSQTIGHLLTGWEVDRILEMTDDMTEYNAYHFVKNYPNIPVVNFSDWHNEEYLSQLGEYDLLFANNPCSGLSSINRNASVDGAANIHFYEVLFAIKNLKPKAFLIENAPTLTGLGLPILRDIQYKLKDLYKLVIINDLAGNHHVAMHRRRTLVVGFRRDYFGDRVGNIDVESRSHYTIKDAFEGLSSSTPNMELDTKVLNSEFTRFYHLVVQGDSIMRTLARKYDDIKDQLTEDEANRVLAFKTRYDSKSNIWDKSSYRVKLDGQAPSLTSIVQLMHPIEDRDLYIREYARLMGYPDSFIFYPNECKCSIIQCLAQGVPVNFIRYISNEIMKAFNGNLLKINGDVMYINQCSGIQKRVIFTTTDFQSCTNIVKNNVVQSLWF